jgi:hypothetical protein
MCPAYQKNNPSIIFILLRYESKRVVTSNHYRMIISRSSSVFLKYSLNPVDKTGEGYFIGIHGKTVSFPPF